MSEIKDSLDQLLHVMKNGENDESVEIYYLIEAKNPSRLTSVADEGLILHITAKRESLTIDFTDESDLKVQENPGQALFVLENKSFEFLEGIGLLEAGSRGTCTRMDKRISALLDSSLNGGSLYETVVIVFLKMIHCECENKSETTAEKLIGLRYPLFDVLSLRNAEVIEQMLIRGCPVNDRHPTDKSTALSRAVGFMNLELVNVLIKYGADVDLADSQGMLPIARYNAWYADGERLQQPEIIKILLKNSVLLRDLPREDIARQFRAAFRCGNQEVIRMLLEYRDDILNVRADSNNRTLLHYLLRNPHPDITEPLKNHEIDVNARDEDGCTPLFWAAGVRDSHINTFKFLLENGADVNARDNSGNVPLFQLCHNAEKKYAVDILELFKQYGLNIEYIRPDETTVFDNVRGLPNYIAILLLEHYAVLEEEGKPITELIRKKISSHRLLALLFDDCKAQLVKMKKITISGNLTLYIILTNEVSEKQILKTCRFSSEALQNLEEVKKDFFHHNFHYLMLEKRISSMIIRLKLMQKAAPVVSQLLQLGDNPSHIIVTEIVYYLDTQDLQALVQLGI